MNKHQINDRAFEALFSQAVIDEFNEEIDSIPSNEELAKIYSFSSEFEIKMKKLFAKDSRQTFIKNSIFFTRKVASIFLVILGLIFSILLFNTEVQATVGKVLVEWYESFTSFTFKDNNIIDEKKDWVLNYLPEGYTEKNYEVLGNITNMQFINNQGEKIRLSYRPEESITNISVDNENHEIDRFVMLNEEAFLISSTNDNFDNGIIWNIDGYTFDLWGKLYIDELIKIAQSISESKE